MDMDRKMRRWQLRIFISCFIAYTAAYICRVNISVALPGIQEALGFSSTSAGLIGTSFFWVYALGQLVNGLVGDKVSSRVFILVGLLASALINIFMGAGSILLIMILLWGANGIFQSMLWGPIVKTLANWFPGNRYTSVAFGMSFSMIIGYFIAWGISGLALDTLGWKWSFWLPAAIVIILAFVWFIMVRNKPEDAGLPELQEGIGDNDSDSVTQPVDEGLRQMSFWKLIWSTNLIFIAVAGVTQGIIKDSISFWTPKLLMDTQNLSLKSTIGVIMIIPVLNFVGILFAGWLNKVLKYKDKITIIVLMSGSSLASLGLFFFIESHTAISVFLIACASAFMFGANPAMTTLIPLGYRKYGRVSSVAGFIDFSIYLGSGLAGAFTGIIVDHSGWKYVFLIWCLAALVGTIMMGASVFKELKVLNCSRRNEAAQVD